MGIAATAINIQRNNNELDVRGIYRANLGKN